MDIVKAVNILKGNFTSSVLEVISITRVREGCVIIYTRRYQDYRDKEVIEDRMSFITREYRMACAYFAQGE